MLRISPRQAGTSIRLFYALLPSSDHRNRNQLHCGAQHAGPFRVPALAPMAVSASIIVGALLLGGRYGIWAMVYSTLAGSLIHAPLLPG